MYTLTTLHQLRIRLGLATTDTADDPQLLTALQHASRQIETTCGRRFSPHQRTLRHTITEATELLLDDDLLELLTLTNGDSTTIPLSDVLTQPTTAPHSLLYLTQGRVFTWQTTPRQAITVTGIWGWHDRPADQWRNSNDALNIIIGSTNTSLTLVNINGTDSSLESPRIQVGHLLRIDSEYLRVLAVNPATNQITVLRGVNGTTAASHAYATPIFTYQPAPDIIALTLRWAAMLYKEADHSLTPPPSLTRDLLPFRRHTLRR
jgi:hypothetical protein